ncbi:MAG TPA: hypothetical protein VMU83_23760 [Hanamia sp.]|nr:hypothetical protein [Hanamia sp.]
MNRLLVYCLLLIGQNIFAQHFIVAASSMYCINYSKHKGYVILKNGERIKTDTTHSIMKRKEFMLNRKLLFRSLLGTVVFFLVSVSIIIFFGKWKLFGFGNRTLQSIIIGGIISSAIFFVWMYIFSKKRTKTKQKEKESL